jgi:UDP-glucose 4-epimerase
VFNKYTFDALMHFASITLVGESVTEPMKYVEDDEANGIHLFEEMIPHRVQRFVLSSTANLFDQPDKIPIDEHERIIPGSPYGESKYILERIVYWLGRTLGMRYGILRYFNACGTSQKYGVDHNPETHLISLIIHVAAYKKEYLEVFGIV